MRSPFKIVGSSHAFQEENLVPPQAGARHSVGRLWVTRWRRSRPKNPLRLLSVTSPSPSRLKASTRSDWCAFVGVLLLPLAALAYEPATVTTFELPPPEPYTPTLADPVTEPWRWTRFPELAGTGVECVTQSSDGDMWFGVDDGVVRYDGLEWTRFDTSDGIYGSKVWVLRPGDDGILYAGTDNGISRFDGERWHRLFPPTGDVSWNITDLEIVSGGLWAATSLGLVYLPREGSAVLYTASAPDSDFGRLVPYVTTVVLPQVVQSAARWGTQDSGDPELGLFVGGTRSGRGDLPAYVVDVAPDGPARRAGIRVGDRVVDRTTHWLLRSITEGALRVVRQGTEDTLVVELESERIERPPALLSVTDVQITDEGVWASVVAGGVFFFDPDAPAGEDSTARFVDVAGIGPFLARTPDGAIWVPTAQSMQPLYRIAGDDVTYLTEEDMDWSYESIYASALTTRNGDLWLGLHRGVVRVLRGGVWSDYDALPMARARVTSLHEATDGALWLVVRGSGAWRLDRSPRHATFENAWYQGSHGRESVLTAWETAADDTTLYVLRHADNTWTRQAVPSVDLTGNVSVVVTAGGQLWAGGSVGDAAATVAIDESTRTLTTHPDFRHGVFQIATFGSDVWVGAHPDTRVSGRPGGALRFDGTRWHHLHGAGAPGSPYGFAQLPNGDIITTGNAVRVYDGTTWSLLEAPAELQTPYTHTAVVDRSGALWIASRAYGVFRLLDGVWTRFTAQDGLPGQQVDLHLGPDGQAWCESALRDAPPYRFDGESWVPALPASLLDVAGDWLWGGVDGDGALWLNRVDGERVGTTRITFDDQRPATTITLAADEISQPGNAVVSWRGADPWRDTPPEELRFAWRLDGGDWSPYTTATTHTFLELSDGDHTLEVRARDRDLNVDPTPAVARFTVVPPVWKQAWFLALVGGLLAAVAVQTTRVIRRERRLTAHNRQLTVERAAERVRAEAMAMGSADDIRSVVGLVRRELIDLGFDEDWPTLINYLDPDDDERLHCYFSIPNPKRFGFGWTSPDLLELDDMTIAAPFVYDGGHQARTVRESIAGDHVDRLDMSGTRKPGRLLVEEFGVDAGYIPDPDSDTDRYLTAVPFAQGQIAVRAPRFLTDDEIEIVRSLCDALSLGFTRFEDFQRLEQASTNKSQFLRRMSHDLRSPMNAIIGYSRLLRRRTADRLDERERRNLANIETSSGNLLNLINDILDLSRIEAGRVEVNLQPVDVRVLANECADSLASIVREGVTLRRDLDDVGEISSDPDRLRQVVMNLLGNATKFTAEGSITLSLRRSDGAESITVASAFDNASRAADSDHAAASQNGLIELLIADTGIGIPADDLPHIFDEFRQVERQGGEAAEGTGLGLAIAKKTVDLLGGEISATSEVGKGTTFTVRLPV